MPTKDIKIFSNIIEESAIEQIQAIAYHPCVNHSVRIMPDVHAGAGCVIGFTGLFTRGVVPNVVGVDIGCGVGVYRLGVDFEKFVFLLSKVFGFLKEDELFTFFDERIRNTIPTGMRCRNPFPNNKLSEQERVVLEKSEHILQEISPQKYILPGAQLGTLGGGNHFLEVDRGEYGECYLVVHTGSRNFGHKIGSFFQKQAKIIQEHLFKEKQKRFNGKHFTAIFSQYINTPTQKGLELLPFTGVDSEAYQRFPLFTAEKYVEYAHVAQEYAQLNRKRIIMEIVTNILGLSFDPKHYSESVHNYMERQGDDTPSLMVRKGAISAKEHEQVIIPLSMRDGCIIGSGKGNSDWNYSAPHGAGRVAGRADMNRKLESGEVTMDDFKEDMRGIYTCSVTEGTIDESSFAYKSPGDIIDVIQGNTIDIHAIIHPVFNLKDRGRDEDRKVNFQPPSRDIEIGI